MTVTCQALINDLEVNFFCFRKQLNKLIDQRINSSTAGKPQLLRLLKLFITDSFLIIEEICHSI